MKTEVGGRICPSTHLNSESNIPVHIRFSVAMGVSKAVEFWPVSYVHESRRTYTNPDKIISVWKSTVVVCVEFYICVFRSN